MARQGRGVVQVATTNSRVSGEEVEAEASILVAPQNHWTLFKNMYSWAGSDSDFINWRKRPKNPDSFFFFFLSNLKFTDGHRSFPHGSVVKNPPTDAGDTGLIPGLGRSPGGRNDNPFQYSCLKIPWTEELAAIVHRVTQSYTQLSTQAHTQRSIRCDNILNVLRWRILNYLEKSE